MTKFVTPLLEYIVTYTQIYNAKKLLSGKRLTNLPSKKYVNDIGNALNELFQITYLWARKETVNDVKKQLPKSEQEKIEFAEIEDYGDPEKINIDDVTGKLYRQDKAINELINELKLQEGNIYLTRLDVDKQLEKSKQIAILSYSDYVNRVNTKLSVAIQTGQPYSTFIKLVKADKIPGFSLYDVVDNKGYWETVFKTNMATIFHAGYLDESSELKEFIAYETYNSINREHAQCAALTGVTRPIGEFEANGNTIPASWNCTAFFSITTKFTADKNNIKPTKNWNKNAKPDRGFGGRTTAKKTSTLPNSTKKRLPSGWTKVM